MRCGWGRVDAFSMMVFGGAQYGAVYNFFSLMFCQSLKRGGSSIDSLEW